MLSDQYVLIELGFQSYQMGGRGLGEKAGVGQWELQN